MLGLIILTPVSETGLLGIFKFIELGKSGRSNMILHICLDKSLNQGRN